MAGVALRAMLRVRGLGLPRLLDESAAAGGWGATAESLGEEVRRRRALLRDQLPAAASALPCAFVVKPLLQESPHRLRSSKVPLVGMVGAAGRRDYSRVAVNEEGWSFIATRYLTPVGKKVDAALRGLGFVPRGPASRILLVIFVLEGLSLGVRHTIEFAVAMSGLVQLLWRHSSSWSWDEARVCQFLEMASTAIVEDASGWA